MINATFNNISIISWWLVLLLEEFEVPGENHPTKGYFEVINNRDNRMLTYTYAMYIEVLISGEIQHI
jgi:hypothetical protein